MKIFQRKQREVRKMNDSYTQLINQALPIEVQQEVEKERLSREKGLEKISIVERI